MKVPLEELELIEFCQEQIGLAFQSLQSRIPLYEALRSLYYYGRRDYKDSPVRYNMIKEKVDTVAAFIFSGETTTFSVDLGFADDQTQEYQALRAERAAAVIREWWQKGNIDTMVNLAVTWGQVYASTLGKVWWAENTDKDQTGKVTKTGRLVSRHVEPWNIGVLNESKTSLDDQEIIVQCYYESKTTVERIIRKFHEKRAKVMLDLLDTAANSEEEFNTIPNSVRRLIVTSVGDNYEGTLGEYPIINAMENPSVLEDMIQMHEIWVYDDDANDYRKITFAGSNLVLFNSLAKDVYVEKEHPYFKFDISPMHDYFWGYPEVLLITKIQEWHEEALADLEHALKRSFDPSNVLLGGQTLPDERDEIIKRLRDPGGFQQFSDPAIKFQSIEVKLPPEIFQTIAEIRGLADDMWGLQDLMKGKGVTGVRSRGQTEILSAYGSARLKSKALRVEDALERLGKLMLKLLKRYDKTHYSLKSGEKFALSQLPDKFQVRIDAHSSSPIFVSEQNDMAFALFDRQVIGKETLIDLLPLPMKSSIKFETIQKDREEQAMVAEQQKQAYADVLDKAIQDQLKERQQQEMNVSQSNFRR